MHTFKFFSSLSAVLLIGGALVGCQPVESAFREMESDRQGQFESDVAYAKRQPLKELVVPLIWKSEDAIGDQVELRWAKYDTSHGMLHVSIPVAGKLYLISAKRGHWHTQNLYLIDPGLVGVPNPKTTVPLDQRKDIQEQLADFKWRVQFQSNIGRGDAFNTARVHLRKLELLYNGNLLWAYTPPADGQASAPPTTAKP